MTAYFKKYNLVKAMRGFTLIELLIVMAILGVLAVVVLVAINPAEQMRRARDTGRISGVQQIGRALTAYYTARGLYPPVGSWHTDIVTSQEISIFPAAVAPATTDARCTPAEFNGFCYAVATNVGTPPADYIVVFSQLVSQQQRAKCTAGEPHSVFSTYDGRGGVVCGVPAAGASLTYVQ